MFPNQPTAVAVFDNRAESPAISCHGQPTRPDSDLNKLDGTRVFQMKTHGVKKCSSSNKVLAHTSKCHLAQILYKKNSGMGLRKAKNCKIIAQI